jgi:hypothetical protein
LFEEKTGMKKQHVVFGLFILLIGIALSGCVNESKKTMGYTKMMSDIKTLPPTDLFTLQSYNDGEVITIEGTVYNVSYYEASVLSGIREANIVLETQSVFLCM